MAYMQPRHFQQLWQDVYVTTRKFFTSVMSYMNIYTAQGLFGCNSEILHYSNVFARRQKVQTF